MSARLVRVERVPDPVRLARIHSGAAPETGWVGVAIDVLRATSTLAMARANGAARIVPFTETADAIAFRTRTEGALACGERQGRILPGFDLGNSPFEYTSDRVSGRTLAFASSNGSAALLSLQGHERIWLGSFVCASAVARACAGAPHVRLVCAGADGAVSPEDMAFAGWIAVRLAEQGFTLDGAEARQVAANAPVDAEAVRARVEGSPNGRLLAAMGEEYARDVEWCAQLDALPEAWEA